MVTMWQFIADGVEELARRLHPEATQPGRARRILLALATAMTAVVVSFSGTVGFVGLIVPYMLRLMVGPHHHRLLATSFLGGAVFLILADLMARTLVRPQELRLGVITAFVGVPFFLHLLRMNRRKLEAL
jgi:iron complex transport system permease protein